MNVTQLSICSFLFLPFFFILLSISFFLCFCLFLSFFLVYSLSVFCRHISNGKQFGDFLFLSLKEDALPSGANTFFAKKGQNENVRAATLNRFAHVCTVNFSCELGHFSKAHFYLLDAK